MLQGSLSTLIILLVIAISVVVVLLLWKGKWFKQWLKGTIGISLIVLSIFFLIGLVDLWSYQQLNKENLISTVSIYELGDRKSNLTLIDSEGKEERLKIRVDKCR